MNKWKGGESSGDDTTKHHGGGQSSGESSGWRKDEEGEGEEPSEQVEGWIMVANSGLSWLITLILVVNDDWNGGGESSGDDLADLSMVVVNLVVKDGEWGDQLTMGMN